MAEYINLEDAIKCVKGMINDNLYPAALRERVAAEVLSGAKSIDIVFCEDCKWRDKVGCALLIADDSDEPKDDDFCSFGEQKEQGDE